MLDQGRTMRGSPCDYSLADPSAAFMSNGDGEGALTYSAPVRLDSRMRVLHLDVLVAHERPGGEVRPVELSGAPEILDGLLVLWQELLRGMLREAALNHLLDLQCLNSQQI